MNRLKFALLGFAILTAALTLVGCGTVPFTVRPVYIPTLSSPQVNFRGLPVTLTVTDNRQNRDNVGVANLAKYVTEPNPHNVVKVAFQRALQKIGCIVTEHAGLRTEVRIDQFDFQIVKTYFASVDNLYSMKLYITVSDENGVLVKKPFLEEFVVEKTLALDVVVGRFLSTVLSRAVDKVCQDPEVLAALQKERDALPIPTSTPAGASAGQQLPKEAKVIVSCAVEGVDVSVDGAFVGNCPATLLLKEGLHTIEVKKEGRGTFKREIRVSAGSEVSIRAELRQ